MVKRPVETDCLAIRYVELHTMPCECVKKFLLPCSLYQPPPCRADTVLNYFCIWLRIFVQLFKLCSCPTVHSGSAMCITIRWSNNFTQQTQKHCRVWIHSRTPRIQALFCAGHRGLRLAVSLTLQGQNGKLKKGVHWTWIFCIYCTIFYSTACWSLAVFLIKKRMYTICLVSSQSKI